MKKRNTDPNDSRIVLPDNASDPRRDILKKLAVGGVAGAALPTQWSKPVIDTVILPAHAQTTTGTLVGGGGGGAGAVGLITPQGGESLADFFVEPAHAGEIVTVKDYCLELSVAVNAGVIQSVILTALGLNGCKGGTQWTNQLAAAVALSPAGAVWVATVLTYALVISNISLTGPKLADSNFGGVPGVVNTGVSCNFGGCPT